MNEPNELLPGEVICSADSLEVDWSWSCRKVSSRSMNSWRFCVAVRIWCWFMAQCWASLVFCIHKVIVFEEGLQILCAFFLDPSNLKIQPYKCFINIYKIPGDNVVYLRQNNCWESKSLDFSYTFLIFLKNQLSKFTWKIS